ncbi:MAG: cytochrome c maturation protein CcmE [Saprospiraceae bacterium]|nr:cytochrome c maturation protein CcmE [Saprospiraceae bacterium]MCB9318866.1 cytochrome c maturation protein CcmE [Lewinellaceae bacterium]
MKRIHIIIGIMIVVGIGLIIQASGDMSTYGTFKEAQHTGKKVKIVGTLARDKEMKYNPEVDANFFSFYLTDENGETQEVIYHKEKPRDFELSEKIVLTGQMLDGTFRATDILLKCPSKYKDEELKMKS